MTIKLENITPDRAKELLKSNDDNRKVKPANVHKYASDMKNGKWGDSNDLLTVDTEGRLTNGQHRLLAVIESGMTIPMWIAYDFDNNGIVDRPQLRTTADQMKMHGVVNAQACTKEAVGLTNCFLRISYGDIRELPDSEKEAFIGENVDNILVAISIAKKGANHAVLRKASTEAAIFAALNAGVPEDKLYRFAECVNTGRTNGDRESSAVTLRNYLIEPNPRGGVMIQEYQAASTEQAIRDFIKGTPRRNAYAINKHVYITPKHKEDE